MKRYIIITMIAALAGMQWGCNGDSFGDLVDANSNSIKVTSSDVTFTAAAAKGTIKYDAETRVRATSSQEWCRVVSISDTEIEVEVDFNESVSSRNALLTLSRTGDNSYLTVSQEGLGISVETNEISLTGFPGQYSIKYVSARVPFIEYSEDWLTVTIDDSYIHIDVELNTDSDRTSVVKIRTQQPVTGQDGNLKEAGRVETLTVRQELLEIEVEEGNLYYDVEGGTLETKFSFPLPVTASTSDPWITGYEITPDSTVKITVEANTGVKRNGTVTLTSEGITKDVIVYQRSLYQSVNDKFVGADKTTWPWLIDIDNMGDPIRQVWDAPDAVTEVLSIYIGRYKDTHVVRGRYFWTSGSNYWATYGLIMEASDYTTDQVTITNNYMSGTYEDNDSYFYERANMLGKLTVICGQSRGMSKTYRIIYADDADDPTEVTLEQVDYPDNWFALSLTSGFN